MEWFFSHIFPWSRTFFWSYQSYIKLLDSHHFYASNQFIDDIPESAVSVDYFCYQQFRKKIVAHSIVLAENEYKQILEKRVDSYYRYSETPSSRLVYKMQETQGWNINDLQKEAIDMDFLDNILQMPMEKKEYNCLVMITINTARGICYTGVIANDTTHEMIKFSVEIPDE